MKEQTEAGSKEYCPPSGSDADRLFSAEDDKSFRDGTDFGRAPGSSSTPSSPTAEDRAASITELASLDALRSTTAHQDQLSIRLPVFEGPLDLLLHLVREHRLDIFDIPIAFITKKYLEMMERMRELNLDVAGEFLVMAATLAHIKSRMLLPRADPEDDCEEEAFDEDPRADLVRRLLEYQKYKEAAKALGSQDILDRDVFPRRAAADAPQVDGEIGLRQVTVFRLIEALDHVLARSKTHVAHEVLRETVSLTERLNEVLSTLAERESTTFEELFEGQANKQAIIMTFLVLLEMSRLGLASIEQEDSEGDIMVRATSRTKETEPAEVLDDFR